MEHDCQVTAETVVAAAVDSYLYSWQWSRAIEHLFAWDSCASHSSLLNCTFCAVRCSRVHADECSFVWLRLVVQNASFYVCFISKNTEICNSIKPSENNKSNLKLDIYNSIFDYILSQIIEKKMIYFSSTAALQNFFNYHLNNLKFWP